MTRSTSNVHSYTDRPCLICGTTFRIRSDFQRRFCSEKCRIRHRDNQKARDGGMSPAEVDRVLAEAVRRECLPMYLRNAN